MDKVVWAIYEEDVIPIAKRVLGRALTIEEMQYVKRGIAHGLDDWQEIVEDVIREAEGG